MEERHPIWRVAANILNKQSRKANKGWSSRLGFGRNANNSSLKNWLSYETDTCKSDLDGPFGMTKAMEKGQEVGRETWNGLIWLRIRTCGGNL
jgi:hypothetical protein